MECIRTRRSGSALVRLEGLEWGIEGACIQHSGASRLERAAPAAHLFCCSFKHKRRARRSRALQPEKSCASLSDRIDSASIMRPSAHGRFRRAPKLWNVWTGIGAVMIGEHAEKSEANDDHVCPLNRRGPRACRGPMRAEPGTAPGAKAGLSSDAWQSPKNSTSRPGKTIANGARGARNGCSDAASALPLA